MFSISIILFQEYYVNGFIPFEISFSELSSISLRSTQVVACINSLFLYIAYLYLYSIAWMYQNVFIHSPDNGFLGCFQSWMIMKAAVSMYVQVIFVNGYPSLLALFY